MSDFGTAVRNLRPGYIAKTTKMRGYLRRHEIGSRSVDPGDPSAYIYYHYEDGRRNALSPSTTPTASAVEAALSLPESGAGSADVVFDLEFVENADWTQEDSKRVYVFRCFQTGGTETSSGDSRTWRVTTVSSNADGASPSTVTVQPKTSSTESDLLIDAATFEMLVSQDWEYNQQLEADYVASTTSQARW